MKFGVIVSDPPWRFGDGLKQMRRPVKRSAASQYDTMTVDDVAAIPVADLVDPRGSVLALWVPGSMLADGLHVMSAWGFRYKQLFVWVKLKRGHRSEQDWNKGTRVGMGRLFRQSHEVALIGVAGRSAYASLQDRSQRSVALDLNLGHSVKPDTLQERLGAMFPDALKLEMFARRTLVGWTCVGNAIDGQDICTAARGLAAP